MSNRLAEAYAWVNLIWDDSLSLGRALRLACLEFDLSADESDQLFDRLMADLLGSSKHDYV